MPEADSDVFDIFPTQSIYIRYTELRFDMFLHRGSRQKSYMIQQSNVNTQ